MTAILLVPSPEWRDRLLRGGPCGAGPPMVVPFGRLWGEPANALGVVQTRKMPAALVLVWEGVVVPEGMDRATRCLAEREGVCVLCGVLWMPPGIYTAFDSSPSWRLRTPHHEWSAPEDLPGVPHASKWNAAPMALATVCATRGMGECVVLP